MATDDLLKQYLVEETSCGPLCQHPQCWASNRRTERGLPRLKDPPQTSWIASDDEGALPTLKVQNLLAESGLGATDDLLTTQLPRHHRSSSAPAVDIDKRPKKRFPCTSCMSFPGVQSTSAKAISSSTAQAHRPTKARSVEVRELFEVDEWNDDWQQAFVPSRVYVWCPSKKAYERQLQKKQHPTSEPNEQNDISIKPVTVKDMTDQMVPEAPSDQTKSTQKMKKKPSRITPTGGRPYTRPNRSPPVRPNTKPVDVDQSIAELLTLPRDILMDVLVHIKSSDSLDKEKVHLLLSRLMPLIHFDTNQPPHRALSPTPLLASGILQNKKMSLLQGGAGRSQVEVEVSTPARHKLPFYLDDSFISAMTLSTHSTLAQQLPMEKSTAADQGVGQSGRMASQPPLGPIRARVSQKAAAQARNKLTSVSTKSLPPLVPGSKPTKPFDYKAAKSLDLTLGPLPTPDNFSPAKPSTPRSEKASSLYFTLPSVLSPDRIDLTTPLRPYGRVSAQVFSERLASQYLHDTPSPINSEDLHPLHAVSPSLSTGVPKAPLGTPVTNIHQTYEPLSAGHHRPARSLSPPKQGDQANAQDVLYAKALGTIREVHSELTAPYPGFSGVETSLTAFPVKHGMTPVSTPWGNCTSITAVGITDPPSQSPAPSVTPQASTATPESWPIVDERDFMTSPEKPSETVLGQEINMATPMAPPPSPEPLELKNDFEFAVNDMSKSGMTSLMPLVEEGEEEEDEKETEEDWDNMMEPTSRTKDVKEDLGEHALKSKVTNKDVKNNKEQKGAFKRENIKEEDGNKVNQRDNTESKDIKKDIFEDVDEDLERNRDKGAYESEDIKDIKQASSSVDIREDVKNKEDESERDPGTQPPKPAIEDDEILRSPGNVLPLSENWNNSAVVAEDIAPDPSRTSGDLATPSSVDDEVEHQMEGELQPQAVQEYPGQAECDSGAAQVSESAMLTEAQQESFDTEVAIAPKLLSDNLIPDIENKNISPEPH